MAPISRVSAQVSSVAVQDSTFNAEVRLEAVEEAPLALEDAFADSARARELVALLPKSPVVEVNRAATEEAPMSGTMQLDGRAYNVIKGEVFSGGKVIGTIDAQCAYRLTIDGKTRTGTLENLTPEVLCATGRAYHGEDAANLHPARVVLSNGKISPEELKARYSDFGKGRLEDLQSLVKSGQLQEAFTTAMKWGYWNQDVTAFFNQVNGTQLKTDEVEKRFLTQSFADLRAQGYAVGESGMRVPFKKQAFIDEVAPEQLPAIDQALNTPITLEDYVGSSNPKWAAAARALVEQRTAISARSPFVVGPAKAPAAVQPSPRASSAAIALPSFRIGGAGQLVSSRRASPTREPQARPTRIQGKR